MAHVCRVVRFYPLQSVLLIQISATPSKMGDGLFTASKCSNSTFIMLYVVHEMDIDYLVVDESINIKNCLVTIACLGGVCFNFFSLFWISFWEVQRLDGPKNEKLRSSWKGASSFLLLGLSSFWIS
jgi:hypothetical protein